MTYSVSAPRTLALGFALVVSALLLGSFAESAEAAKTVKKTDAALTVQSVLVETNKARTAAGLPALTSNSLLNSSAQTKANDMAKNNYFAHNAQSGAKFWTLIDAVGYKYMHAGENLGLKFATAPGLLKAWLNSPTHRANIMNANYDEIGIGIAYGSNGSSYVTAHYGSTTY